MPLVKRQFILKVAVMLRIRLHNRSTKFSCQLNGLKKKGVKSVLWLFNIAGFGLGLAPHRNCIDNGPPKTIVVIILE